MYDLIEYGSIYQIEKLELTRKRYPQSDVIYFLETMNSKSLQHVVDDFPPDDEDPFNYDSYGQVHLCFSQPFTDSKVKEQIL